MRKLSCAAILIVVATAGVAVSTVLPFRADAAATGLAEKVHREALNLRATDAALRIIEDRELEAVSKQAADAPNHKDVDNATISGWMGRQKQFNNQHNVALTSMIDRNVSDTQRIIACKRKPANANLLLQQAGDTAFEVNTTSKEIYDSGFKQLDALRQQWFESGGNPNVDTRGLADQVNVQMTETKKLRDTISSKLGKIGELLGKVRCR